MMQKYEVPKHTLSGDHTFALNSIGLMNKCSQHTLCQSDTHVRFDSNDHLLHASSPHTTSIHICVTYQQGYILRNELLGNFVILLRSYSALKHT